MKIYFKYLFISIGLLTASNAFSQVGIGTNTPAASAALEVTSDANNKGILIPRITATQKDAISSPAQGLLIYQTTAPSGFYYYSGTAWKLIANQADTELKVDKVTGKDLSTNDYTTSEKTKLAAITGTNTGDQDLSNLATNAALDLKANTADLITSLDTKVDKVTGKDLSTNDYTTAEKTKLAAITGTNTGDQTSITGNAGSATKLATPRKINNVDFDGTADITITSAVDAGAISGTMAVANGGTGATTVNGILATLGLANNNVAIGAEAGTPGGVNSNTVAIGGGAGRSGQGQSAIGIGYVAGTENQGANGIAIGSNTAQANQASQAIALGYAAGQYNQGANAVAIGSFAGNNAQQANSIAINATGASLNPTNAGFYVDPIRSAAASQAILYYDPTTKEITSATASGSFVDLSTDQTIAGNKTFSSDLSINGVKIGKGTGQNDQNTAIGAGALSSSNASGTRNTAVGYLALKDYSGTSFDNNTGVGYFNMIGLTTGGGNTSVGAETMFNVASGSNNTGIGNQSLISTSGNNNVGVGTRSGDNLTTGSNNTFIGTQARTTSAGATISNATAIGYDALVETDNTIQLGNASVSNVKTSGTLTAGSITYPNVSGTNGQVLTTNGSGAASWSTPSISTISGILPVANGGTGISTLTGIVKGNGTNSMTAAVPGTDYISPANIIPQYRVTLGSDAGINTTDGYSVSIGRNANKLWNGSYNTAVGSFALETITAGAYNQAFGDFALQKRSSGSYATGIGAFALQELTTGMFNTSLGTFAGDLVTTGSQNTLLGHGADPSTNNSVNQTVIGYNAVGAGNNSVQLGNSDVTNVKTSGTITSGSITYPNVSGTNGQVLTTDGNGTASWGSVSAPAGNTFVTNIAGPINTSNYNPGDVVYDRSAGTFYLFKSPKQSSLGFTGADASFSFFDAGKNVIRMRPTVTGNITSISLDINNATNAVFSIYSSLSACAPGGGALNRTIATVDTSTLLGSSNSNSGNGIVTFTFATPISVTANTDYYLTVSSAINSVGSIRVKSNYDGDSNFSISYGTCEINQGSPSVQIIYATSYSTL
jgi:hypothetical protein